ncbi:hypothetical protein C8R44DRAFT_845065 [Mycena epipterygia]|nr:hypothetical protein C8R44DRAFT_845065 [Mycena epipterygia]
MSNISPVQTLLALVSLIPNNHIRYALLELGASITVLFGVRLQRPSSRLGHLEESVADTEKMTQQAKLCWPRVQVSLTEHEVEYADPYLSFGVPYCRFLEIPGLGNGSRTISSFIATFTSAKRKLRGSEWQCRFRQPTVEAERRHKYTGDIRETEAIVTAVRDPIGTIAHSGIICSTHTVHKADMYKESGGSANFHYSASESYSHHLNHIADCRDLNLDPEVAKRGISNRKEAAASSFQADHCMFDRASLEQQLSPQPDDPFVF